MGKQWFHGLTAEHDSREAKAERGKLREVIGVLLALVFCMAIVGLYSYSLPAKAEEIPLHIYDDGETLIRLLPGPCSDPAVKPFLEAVGELDRFKAVDSTFTYRSGERKRHGGCWSEFSGKETGGVEVFLIIFDDGDKAAFPKAEFLRGKGQGT